ncbi:polyhydroxyalkanoate depolymerase [Kaistia dalseonensis]|uniref:Poly(3-hydroxybutyrate) depolymerase n=1 Tax=Kaistia dalseonensis TaxID=410840 RepID=A0ABU0H5U7_9HYPH|nr:polyhydroxyalkanoate depolymerase [Kaistia dalseonensis]MCX5495097.1 polyhydroxyalkanoate depolymerase [Kaistia dalseonensis]MDQ0437679.1 poly(3-hydroxybutyrate) depolymerase [Kaistia dalseonensis]
MSPLSYYQLYELNHAALSPMRVAADIMKLMLQNPFNPLGQTPLGKNISAGLELFERTTRRYGKPAFGLPTTLVGGERVPVVEEIVWQAPFCNLIHFDRVLERPRTDPKLLIVAPMSGHYATLLRGTVDAMLPKHDVYITDWIDARMVPLTEGSFDLDDYVDYVIAMLQALGENTHVIAVCQPAVPVLAAAAVMEARNDPFAPRTMTLMGGPIDTRINPTAVNKLAEGKTIDWFEQNVVMKVPFPHPGFMRDVYPGFLQLSGFMSMNLDRHVTAHKEFFQHLVDGDGDSQTKHRDFYDEYLAVMDLSAAFYLQTVDTVFIKHSLPKGEMLHRGERVDLTAIRNVALLTVEGENDDISGVGQTEAAQHLCVNIPGDMRAHYVQPKVGHYGVFNGSRFRAEIAPRISDFILTHNRHRAVAPDAVPVEAVAPAAEPVAPEPKPAPGRATQADTLAALVLARPDGVADDLKLISGVGPKLEATLNGLGIFHLWQLAALTDKQISELDERLAFKGRVARDKWVEQAKTLARETTSS